MGNCDFKVGEHVVYGTSGVCLISDISLTSFSPAIPPRQYYILTQVKSSSTIYVPFNGLNENKKMRYLLTKDEIEALISSVKGKSMEWNNDRKARSTRFREILAKGVCEEFLLMIQCIYQQKSFLEQNKKKLSNTDSDLLFTAQTLLEDEFSFVLGMSCQDVARHVKGILGISDISLF